MGQNYEEPKRKFGIKKFALLVCKTANVALTVLAFLKIFISDLHFDIKDDINDYMEEMGI